MGNSSKNSRRIEYPCDDDIVSLFVKYRCASKVAKDIGVPRTSFLRYLNSKPDLIARCKEYWKLPAEVVEERRKLAKRRWKRNNREKVLESKRRWARNRSSADRKESSQRSKERRAAKKGPSLSVEDALELSFYLSVIEKDPCVYCGAESTTKDHIQPINYGGSDKWNNMAPACRSCNSSKKDKSLLQFLLWKLDL